MGFNIEAYCRERNAAVTEAVQDGNVERLKRLAGKIDAPMPSDMVILISAHKMCLEITTMPEELKEKSRKWLKENGYKEGIR